MIKLLLAVAFTAALASIAEAQQVPDPRVADLVQAGKIRVALFIPQYTKDPQTGDLKGGIGGGVVLLDVARALGARIGVEVVPIGHPTPPEAMKCLVIGACDMGFMGPDPSRADALAFSPPFMEIDFTYLVPADSPVRSGADVDRAGVRIAAMRNHSATFALRPIIKQAELVYADTPDAALELLRSGRTEVFAVPRMVALEYSAKLPGLRVLGDRYGANLLAISVPKVHAGRLAYMSEFVEQAKASGLVQQAIDRAGIRGIQVAPLEKSN